MQGNTGRIKRGFMSARGFFCNLFAVQLVLLGEQFATSLGVSFQVASRISNIMSLISHSWTTFLFRHIVLKQSNS
jgi:hypothetical protein